MTALSFQIGGKTSETPDLHSVQKEPNRGTHVRIYVKRRLSAFETVCGKAAIYASDQTSVPDGSRKAIKCVPPVSGCLTETPDLICSGKCFLSILPLFVFKLNCYLIRKNWTIKTEARRRHGVSVPLL